LKSKGANKAIHDAGFVVEAEVKASIAGQRAEPTSVDTGQFLNSVKTDNSKKMQSMVSSDVPQSLFMEFGTSRITERRHFRNSKERKKQKINTMIKEAIK